MTEYNKQDTLSNEQIRYLKESSLGPDAGIVVDMGYDPIAAYTPIRKQVMQAEREIPRRNEK